MVFAYSPRSVLILAITSSFTPENFSTFSKVFPEVLASCIEPTTPETTFPNPSVILFPTVKSPPVTIVFNPEPRAANGAITALVSFEPRPEPIEAKAPPLADNPLPSAWANLEPTPENLEEPSDSTPDAPDATPRLRECLMTSPTVDKAEPTAELVRLNAEITEGFTLLSTVCLILSPIGENMGPIFDCTDSETFCMD